MWYCRRFLSGGRIGEWKIQTFLVLVLPRWAQIERHGDLERQRIKFKRAGLHPLRFWLELEVDCIPGICNRHYRSDTRGSRFYSTSHSISWRLKTFWLMILYSHRWPLRWGWVFPERTRILSGIQFTTYFIEILVVETKRFVSSFVNVILTRQTCGQRSSRAAESKRQMIGNYFSERICYMLLISKCRGDPDLGLCTTSVLAFGQPQRNGKIRKKNVFWHRKNRILPLCCGCPNASTEVVHSPRPQSPLHFDIRNM